MLMWSIEYMYIELLVPEWGCTAALGAAGEPNGVN